MKPDRIFNWPSWRAEEEAFRLSSQRQFGPTPGPITSRPTQPAAEIGVRKQVVLLGQTEIAAARDLARADHQESALFIIDVGGYSSASKGPTTDSSRKSGNENRKAESVRQPSAGAL